jgi:type VI secretion system secreted protein VgrG
MAKLTNRTVSLSTPFGADVLLPRMISGSERLSEPFRYDLQVLSEKGELNADDILGKELTLSFQLPSGGAKRFFNGMVTEFSQLGYRRRFHLYQLSIRPWFWLLTRTADCRIFQQMSVPDIFEEVVKQYGFTDYKLKLKGSYQKWDYCVQYRETDFNFLSRLLEQEGIYYYFEHTDGTHMMVLADDGSAHGKVPGYESVPFFPPEASDAQRERDHLSSWSFTKSVRTTAYATTDFDFKNPRQSLLSNDNIARQHAQASFEVFDYPAELSKFSSGESSRISEIRIQELQAAYALMRGQGDAAGLAAGARFKLTKYPRADLNIEYLIIGTSLSLSSDDFDAGHGGETEFSLSLDAIDAKTPFRPERNTPKPIVQGAQTAMVVGPGGEEIYTDEHGRVKVQFHWDRYGKNDEKSSCWVRVAQIWAGKQWGAIHIPRIGQEVIVSFLEGDPDKPIITGRVYNGDSMPPYALPANKTQSGIKSRSSKDGAAANFNEFRFEDKKGSEQVFLHAEKNQDIEVENDETHWVGHDRKKTVDHDETTHVKHDRMETVDSNENITIGINRTESVGSNESISVGSNRSKSVGGSETVSVALQRTHTVGVNESIAIGAAQEVAIGAAQTITVGANQSTSVGNNQSINVGSDATTTIGKNEKRSVGENRTTEVAKDDKLSVGKKFLLVAEDEITIKTGDASIIMKKDGTITIKGKDITLNGSGKINVKASSDVAIKGSKVTQN